MIAFISFLTAVTLQVFSGIVVGAVTNGTPGADPNALAGLTVELYSQTPDGETRLIQTTVTDDSGAYRFDFLDRQDKFSYTVVVEYEGVTYRSQTARIPQTGTADLPVQVYEISSDTGKIRLERAHFILDIENDHLLVTEMLLFDNDTDHTIAGNPDGAGFNINIPLPQDADGVQLNDPALQQSAAQQGVWLNLKRPLPPGPSQVIFSYILPYQGPQRDVTLILPYQSDVVDLLVANLGEQVTVTGLEATGIRSGLVAEYFAYAGDDLSASTTLQVKLDNIPRDFRSNSILQSVRPWWQSATIDLASLALALAALILVFYLFFLRRPSA